MTKLSPVSGCEAWDRSRLEWEGLEVDLDMRGGLHSVLNVKELLGVFNQDRRRLYYIDTFSVIVKLSFSFDDGRTLE